MPIGINQIRRHRGAKINNQTPAAGKLVTCHQRQPAIETEPLVLAIAIANPGQHLGRSRLTHRSRKCLLQQTNEVLRFLLTTHAYQTTERQRRNALHCKLLEQRRIRLGDSGRNRLQALFA
ncbi:hypothetical protein D9M73_284160 [compost metagenome]